MKKKILSCFIFFLNININQFYTVCFYQFLVEGPWCVRVFPHFLKKKKTTKLKAKERVKRAAVPHQPHKMKDRIKKPINGTDKRNGEEKENSTQMRVVTGMIELLERIPN